MLKQKQQEIHPNLEITTCDPLEYIIAIPSLLFQSAWENPLVYNVYKGLKKINAPMKI